MSTNYHIILIQFGSKNEDFVKQNLVFLHSRQYICS